MAAKELGADQLAGNQVGLKARQLPLWVRLLRPLLASVRAAEPNLSKMALFQ